MNKNASLILGLTILTSTSVSASTFDGWHLNGTSALINSGNTLHLTDATEFSAAGTAWAPDKVSLNKSFSIAFSFEMYGGTPGDLDPTWNGDGITFTLHNDPNGVAALGAAGGGLGLSGINPTVSFVFDSFVANEGDMVASQVGGTNFETDYITMQPVPVNSGSLRNAELFAWVDYDGVNKELRLFLNDSNVKPLSEILWLGAGSWEGYFGTDQLYFGFTSATGGATDNHNILSYSLTTVPLPSAIWMLGSGLLGLVGLQKRQNRV